MIDASDRIVMRYDYDMLGNRIHQASMEAGERWMLNDVAGKPIYALGQPRSRVPHRPTTRCAGPLRVRSCREGVRSRSVAVGRTIYGEGQPNAEVENQRGKVVQLFDQAGVVTTEDYDFKGNLLASAASWRRTTRRRSTGRPTVRWSRRSSRAARPYDALNRPVAVTTPDGSVYRPAFNEANLLEKVDVNLRGAQTATPFVTNIDYDAKGQRVLIEYGNGVKTTYAYDPLTFRLTSLKTTRATDPARSAGPALHLRPRRQHHAHPGRRAADDLLQQPGGDADNDYTYDAVYRLIAADGREHIGQAPQPQTTWDDRFACTCRIRTTGRRCAATPSSTSTTRSATSCD